jgi:lysophospholipase L1-like esterase
MRPITICGIFVMAFAFLAAVVAPACRAQTGATMPATASVGATKWIDAWAVSFLPTTVNGAVQSTRTFNNQTVRLNVFAKLGGTQARVKFTNKFTSVPLVIGAAHIARRASGAAIDPATDHTLSFKGETKVTIPPGEELWSDPAPLEIQQHTDVAISIFIPDAYQPTGFHPTGLKTSYIGEGDMTAAATIAAGGAPGGGRGRGGGRTIDQIFLISDLQVMAPASTHVIVTIGDSITDGAASATDANGSWPDILSKRLPKLADGTPVAVINMGIGSNRFVTADRAGPTGTKRFDDDVLARPNVTHLIILEGINDISYEQVKPEALIDAYKAAIAKAHAKGIKVFMATLLPIQNSTKDTPANLATQQAVNKWIRAGEGFEGVIDFEKVMQDPQNPLRIRANLTGDFVHPNTQGYKLMGESMDLKLFEK